MSWVQLNGITWPMTRQIAEVKLHHWREDAQCPRQQWSLELSHCVSVAERDAAEKADQKLLLLRLETLGFSTHDWRRLEGYEFRADAAWHTANDHCHEYGKLVDAMLDIDEIDCQTNASKRWRAHDFAIRFGTRDGYSFPMELDAWLIPESEFWRRTPEPPEELLRRPTEPPDLRIMATAFFTNVWTDVPPSEDPVPIARRIMREELALEDLHDPKTQWHLRQAPCSSEIIEMPGSSSTICFKTEPGKPRRRRMQGE